MLEVPRENLQHGKLYYINDFFIVDDYNSNRKMIKMVGIFKGLKLIDPIIVQPWNAAVFDWLEVSKMKEISQFEVINEILKVKYKMFSKRS